MGVGSYTESIDSGDTSCSAARRSCTARWANAGSQVELLYGKTGLLSREAGIGRDGGANSHQEILGIRRRQRILILLIGLRHVGVRCCEWRVVGGAE